MTPPLAKALRLLCMLISAATFVAAAIIMVRSDDKSDGIFAVLIAALLSRLLVLDVGGWLERRANPRGQRDEPEGQAETESPKAE